MLYMTSSAEFLVFPAPFHVMSRKIHYPWDNVLNNGYLSMGLSMGLLCIEGGHLVGGVGEILIKKNSLRRTIL